VGIPLVRVNICQRFKYEKNRAVSMVLSVFEALTNIDFQRGNPTFLKQGFGCNRVFPRKKAKCIRPIAIQEGSLNYGVFN